MRKRRKREGKDGRTDERGQVRKERKIREEVNRLFLGGSEGWGSEGWGSEGWGSEG